MTTKPREPRLSPMDEGGWVVSGTLDVDLAQLIAAREITARDLEFSEPPGVHYVGWMRWNPCHPSSCYDGGGHHGHLEYVDGPGRGNWLGVHLDDIGENSRMGVDPLTVGAE